ncbi:MAG: hypothetical protein SEPTF4163_004891 [Sporothrix epigloea]
MTPHARKFSLFQASLKASVKASSTSTASESFQVSGVLASSTSQPTAEDGEHKGKHKDEHEHESEHDRDRDHHNHRGNHEHKKQWHHHHGHHLPSSQTGKKEHHDAGHPLQVPSSVSLKSELYRTQVSSSAPFSKEAVQTISIVEAVDDNDSVVPIQTLRSNSVTPAAALSVGTAVDPYDTFQTPEAEFFVAAQVTEGAVAAAVVAASPISLPGKVTSSKAAETRQATLAIDAALILPSLIDAASPTAVVAVTIAIDVADDAGVAAPMPTQQPPVPENTDLAEPTFDGAIGAVEGATALEALPTQQATIPEDYNLAGPIVDASIGLAVGVGAAASLPTPQAVVPIESDISNPVTSGASEAASLPTQQAAVPADTNFSGLFTDGAIEATGGIDVAASLPTPQATSPVNTDLAASVTAAATIATYDTGAAASSLSQQATAPINTNSAGQSTDAAAESAGVSSAAASLPTQQANATVTAVSSSAATTATSALPLTTSPSSALPPANGNSTSTHNYTNSTLPYSLFANSSRTSTSLSSLSQYTSSTFSSSLVVSSTSSTFAGEVTGADGTGGAGNAAATASAGSSTNPSDEPSTGPPTNVLVGSVVGGLAGMAVLLIVVMALLRWKRKRDAQGHRLLCGGDDGAGPSDPGGFTGDSGPSRDMSENRTNFLMPLASILTSGQKHLSRAAKATVAFAPSASESTAGGGENVGNTERGFYRVSGKKLPSVLQHGGDGYEDPRESVLSMNPTLHRDSHGYFGGAGGPATTPSSHYAVGSPMRPKSGVPVFHNGPGKAVSMRAPLSRHGSSTRDEIVSVRHLTPPSGMDPIGRSRTSQDNSRISRSRFAEDIL